MNFRLAGRSWRVWSTCVAAAVLLSACASPLHRAPVEERNLTGSVGAAPSRNGQATPAAPAAHPHAGQPGYYTVKPGDTLIRVGLETGQSWRDIMQWNQLENPNVLEVGQVLRVVPPTADATVASTKPVGVARVESRPLEARATAAASAPPSATPAPAASSPPQPAAAPVASGQAREVDDILWTWPAAGSVIAGFDETRNKGLGIAGKPGDPVFAAADGKVVYAGSGLRGYGNLVIVKHSNSYLTAYAHNQALLVKEDQTVRRGQKIAEMGSTDADRVKLHFEIRKEGKPVDPARYLPPR
ncbi:peptidoglycan DD-metalloendopeptidase family protein [Caldimonas sp.]|uniref:peptidoglycan DD-metalloendopeptidase family protein n=1 Tax=Caldimonas sp. TaxID=2838790 RepID=UPI00307E677D